MTCSPRTLPLAQVVGMVFAEEELELVTGGVDGTFLVWQMPTLVLKQRFTRVHSSPLVSSAVGRDFVFLPSNYLQAHRYVAHTDDPCFRLASIPPQVLQQGGPDDQAIFKIGFRVSPRFEAFSSRDKL